MSPDAEVTRLGATDLGSEMPGRAQQRILGGVNVTGTSTPEYMMPSSTPQILAPAPGHVFWRQGMHSKPTPVHA